MGRSVAGELRGANDDRLVARVFRGAATGYWRGATRRQAWTLTLGLGLAVLLSIGCNVGISWWNRWFFDSLENRDATSVGYAVLAFLALALLATAISVGIVLGRETIQVRWREWLTAHLVEPWLGRQRFYHLSGAEEGATIPEYRIADDVRWATEPLIDFYIGLLTAAVSFVSFIGILWVVGGAITVGGVTIPAYMVLAAILHAGCVTGLMLAFGRTLPGRMAARNEAEAKFRFALMRLRENAESVAMMRGEAAERTRVVADLAALVARWMAVVRQDGQLTWILSGNGVLLPVVPLLLVAPKYLSGEISLGVVVQLATAYIPVQQAIAWINDNFRPIANWHASARRVGELVDAMNDLDRDLDEEDRTGIVRAPSDDGRIRVANLSVTTRARDVMVAHADLAVDAGEKVLLTGESGAGKSALVRAIAGLWPWGVGRVWLPRDARLSYVPQRAYLPLGSLRDAARYPLAELAASDEAIRGALERCGLDRLACRLDAVERWDQVLSNGERQRFAFARLLVQRPDIVILDDAVAALDDASQSDLMAMLRRELDTTTVISVAHHSGLERFHDRTLALKREAGGSRLIAAETASRAPAPAVPPARPAAAAPSDQPGRPYAALLE